jgi:hypothetical protein
MTGWTAALLGILAIGCSASTGNHDPASAPVAGAATKPPVAAQTGVAMEAIYQDLPDDRWRHAAEVAFAHLQRTLTETGSVRIVVRPWTSPEGATLPYLLRVEATKADGSLSFHAVPVVLDDKVVNGGGATAATGVLAAAGFPGTHVSLGHLLDVLFLTRAVDAGWLQPPSAMGWNFLSLPGAGVPELDYADGGAVLHLHRAATGPTHAAPGRGGGPPAMPSGGPPAMPSGGPPHLTSNPPSPWSAGNSGFTMLTIERLDVVFDAGAGFTTRLLRQSPDKSRWEPVP